MELTNEKLPRDLELWVEPSCSEREGDTVDNDNSTVLDIDRRFFDELYYTPLITQRSHGYHFDDCDGSSYSTNHHIMNSWKTDSTDATRPTKNTLKHHYIFSGSQVSV
jgi:hypothetical protein